MHSQSDSNFRQGNSRRQSRVTRASSSDAWAVEYAKANMPAVVNRRRRRRSSRHQSVDKRGNTPAPSGSTNPFPRPLRADLLLVAAMFLLYTAYHQLGCLFPDNYMELQCGANSADTLNHVAVFAALAAPIAAFYPGALRWAVPVLVVSGGVAEIVQPFIGRTASSMDFLANFCGVFIGVCAGRIVWRWRGSNAYGWR